jgi:magnesium-transporting ATPase (P-type)
MRPASVRRIREDSVLRQDSFVREDDMTFDWERFSPLAGMLAVVGMVVAFGLGSGTPSSDESDGKITSYYASNSHQTRSVVAWLLFTAAILVLLFFFATLRARLVSAERTTAKLSALAFGSGVASAVLWAASVFFFTGPGLAANDTSKFKLDPNTYRLFNDTGYAFWVGAVMVGALVVWATSAVALRTGLLPRWFAWLGVLVGIIQLFAVFFVPAFVYWGWILVASVLLTWRPAPASAAGI